VTIRVAGDDDAGFYARPDDPHVQGYVWWKLTTGAIVQALWILLLPFTLFNVANWMFPEKTGHPRRPARVATRSLMFLLGISLTLTYLLWEYTLVVQQLAYQWKLGGWLDGRAPTWAKNVLPWLKHPSARSGVIVGVFGVILVGGVVYYVARSTRRDFEEFPGPEQHLDPKLEPPIPLLGHPLSSPERLDHPSFWSRPRASARLLTIHMLAGALMLAGLVAWTIPRAHPGQSLELRPWFVGLARAQILLVLSMLILYFVGWDPKTHFKFAPPVMVATASVALTIGFFSGFTAWLGNRLNLSGVSVDLDLSGAFGIGSVVYLGSLILWLGWYWHRRHRELDRIDERDIPANTAPPGAEPNGASPRMLRRIALFRSFSTCLERLDVLVTAGTVAFAVAAAGVLFLDRSPAHWFDRFGRWELLTLVSIALPALIFRAFKPSDRSKVKTLWDITTFWPRRFHPFAVRPYAERAVPEIQGRLYELVIKRKSRVVVAAHSQGAVLAYCALVHLAQWHMGTEAEQDGQWVARNVALVTFGCPLHRLHANYFPAYFVHPKDFEDLATKLFDDGNPSTSWTNFYHRTDYVGQKTLDGTNRSPFDFELPDPAKRPPYRWRSVHQSWAVPADPPLPIFTRTLIHSYYNNSVELRAWVRVIERRLSR
jgi:hypothetical protein